MKIVAFLIALLIFVFCSDSGINPQKNNFTLSDTLLIRYHESLINEEEEISIKFDELISDGRCPVDMMCFWEGDAELRFAFSNTVETIKFNLHTAGNYFTKDTVVLGYHIKLLDLYPYPHSKKEVSKNSYEAKIIIDNIEVN
ncbi:MAG: hypothetical protein OQJ81_04445 [Melioribacteraceae bacterium]|nr:hypothetical protein [Melioribacteraceae bacterium]